MPIFDIRCPACQQAREFIGTSAQIADQRCEVCGGPVERVWAMRVTAVADDVPGGFWIENMTPKPLYFRSKSEWKAKMKELGLVNKVEHVGVPGTDRSPHTTRWT